MTPTHTIGHDSARLYLGDCREIMRLLPARSVDAVVCDPPYEIALMGKRWDATGVAFDPATWAECLRVLKPGGHLVAFGACRTSHRITCAIEDAGFEIRDTLQWVFGEGYPKSLDVSKALDKAAGVEQATCGPPKSAPNGRFFARFRDSCEPRRILRAPTSPATDTAKVWAGYGTTLKPAHEPITLARKPLDGTVAHNVTTWGTGGLDIDGCRVGDTKRVPPTPRVMPNTGRTVARGGAPRDLSTSGFDGSVGRWPPNILLGEGAHDLIEDQADTIAMDFFPSFYYTPKASRSEREAGLQAAGITPMTRADVTGRDDASPGQNNPRAGMRGVGDIYNTHPTVKPVDVMRWLVRLVTPPRVLGPVVLDPFCGSGTTGIAAMIEGARFIGCELDMHHMDIAHARIQKWYTDKGARKVDPRSAKLGRRRL